MGRKERFSRGSLYMVLAAFFFSLMAVFVKTAGLNIPPQEMVFARSLVVFSITALLIKRAGLPLWGRNKKLLILRGLFGYLGLSAFFYTLTTIPIADSVMLQYTSPLFTALFAVFILKEKSALRQWGYFLLAFAGVLVIIRPGFSLQAVPAMVGLGGAAAAGIAYNLVRKLRETDHALNIILYLPAMSMLLSFPQMLADFVMPRGWEWLALLAIGVTTQIAQIFLTRSLHYETAARATNMAYSSVLFSALFGILFWGEIPSLYTILGALLVIYALWHIASE